MGQINFPATFADKTILVAGAAGFLPSTLAEFYLKKGASVIGLDNFITGQATNIEVLTQYEKFKFYEADIIQDLPPINGPIDYVFGLASPASPIDFDKYPIEILRVNSEGTHNLLKLAQNKGARFLNASTSEVYGDPLIHPQKEDYYGNVNPNGPRACYDESKRFSEALTLSFAKQAHLETRIVRIFNTYGPRMRSNDGRVIPNFVNQAMNNRPITVYGDGSQTRSYCYVTDLVDAIHYVMFSDDPTPFNVGNPDEYSILETAETIIEVLKSRSTIKFLPLPKDDPKKRKPDLSKLQAICDYQPKVSFQEGLLQTVEYFKSQGIFNV